MSIKGLTLRKFIKLSLGTSMILVSSTLYASDKHLRNLTFHELYPKSFWQKSYFGWVVMASTVAVAGTITYFTAGAGAPAAASGVGSVASWIGGGGAGSYMAGLSTVGASVGGDAMVGAAILNGISLGTIGYGASSGGVALGSKIALTMDMTLNGIAIYKDVKSTKKLYVFDLKIPQNIGSKSIQNLAKGIYDKEIENRELLEDLQDLKQGSEKYNKLIFDINIKNKQIKKLYLNGIQQLTTELKKEFPNQENLLVLGIIAYNNGSIGLFKDSLRLIDINYSPIKRSFLSYLKAVEILSTSTNIQKAKQYLYDGWNEEPYVIEFPIALISLLGEDKVNTYTMQKIQQLATNSRELFDSDKYQTNKNLSTLFFKVANIAEINGFYSVALKYYKKSYDELTFFIKHLPIAKQYKNNIKIRIAFNYFKTGEILKAKEIKEEVLDDTEENVKQEYLAQFKEMGL